MASRIRPSLSILSPSRRALLRPPLYAFSHHLPITTTSSSTTTGPSHSTKTREQKQKEFIELLERQILHPERAETSYSATDNAAGDDKISYDPSVTNPEMELRSFEEEIRLDGEVDPLFISPANRDFSQLLNPEDEVVVHWADKVGKDGLGGSTKGWTRKAKEVLVRKAKSGGEDFDEYERLLRGLRALQRRREQVSREKGDEDGKGG